MAKSDGPSKMQERALQGSAFGPWGTLAGGFVGGVESMFDDSGGYDPNHPLYAKGDGTGMQSGVPPTRGEGAASDINEAAFSAPGGGDYFGQDSGGQGAWWLGQAGEQGGDTGFVDAGRADRGQSRQTQQEGLGWLGQYARGDKSAARLASKAQADRTMAAIQSRMASTPGGYNPSVQARGIDAVSGASQQLAGQAAAQAAAEQLASQKAYLQATGQMRQQDLAGQLAEQQWYAQQQQAKMAYQNMKAKYLALGLDERNADRAAAMELERLKSGAASTSRGQDITASQIANQQDQFDTNRMDNYTMGGIKSIGDYLAQKGMGAGSDSGGGGDSGGGVDYWDWD